MNLNLYFLLFSCVATSTWLQAASGKHLPYNRLNDRGRYFASDEEDIYFEGEHDKNDNQPAISEKDLPRNGELFEGDMVMDNTIRRAVLGLNSKRSAIQAAAEGKRRHWPLGVVPYTVDDSFKPILRKQLKAAIVEFNEYTCVHYRPKRDTDENYVTFTDGKGCSSSVGRQGGQQFIHLAYGCKRIGTVMHEMMHAIGIIHEQSRPDRDEHLEVRFDHIKPKLLPNFRKYTLDEADNMDVPYNFFSVMHYSNYAFTRDEKKTLIAKSDHNLKFGQRVQLTKLDVEQINRLYPCNKKFDESELLPDMTERDVVRRKRDYELKDLYKELF